MPVATQGTVKSLVPADLRAAGAQIVLANSYHLSLRPGPRAVRELGGPAPLHGVGRADPDRLRRLPGLEPGQAPHVREEGVEFRSHVDGSLHFLSPESSVEIQRALGVDIMHPLDECLAHPATEAATERSLALTLRWLRAGAEGPGRERRTARRCSAIVQGGVHRALRRRAAEETVALGFAGYSIGGLAVGEPRALMYDMTELVAGLLPADQPRYLMGVGKPEDLVEAVARGVDMFDCVLPTRNARNGQVFTPDGPLTISQARFARDPAPIDAGVPLRRVPPLLARLPPAPVHVARAHSRTGSSRSTTSPSTWGSWPQMRAGHRGRRVRRIPGSLSGSLCAAPSPSRPRPSAAAGSAAERG